MWVAGKAQKVRRNGKIVELQPGDPIPEAEHWPNRPAWIRSRHIRWIERPESKSEPKKVAKKPAVVVKVESVEPSFVPEISEEEVKPKAKKKKAKTKAKAEK
jgi:hypothetical protein